MKAGKKKPAKASAKGRSVGKIKKAAKKITKPAKKAARKATKKAAPKKAAKKIVKKPAKRAIRKTVPGKITDRGDHDILITAEITRLAIVQNKTILKANHKNIAALSDTLKNGEHVVAIYINDNKKLGLPRQLEVLLPNGLSHKVRTEIIPGTGSALPHIGQAVDELSDTNSNNYMGTICCLVKSTTNPAFRGIVTSGHIFTYGTFFNYGGVLALNKKRSALINQQPKAELFFQKMTYNQDLAIVEVIDQSGLLDNYRSFSKGAYTVTDADLKSPEPNVTIISRQNNIRDAYILDYNVSFEVQYFNLSKEISGIILIGSTNDRANAKTVSVGGDSGSAVYHKKTGKLIGMLMGGNDKFTFVLPLEEALQSFNFEIL